MFTVIVEFVLNLIINGIPSILEITGLKAMWFSGF